jgi:hypothetical protein
MTTQAPQSYTKLAAAIVVAAVVIGAGIAASSYFGTARTTTITSTVTETTISNVTVDRGPFLYASGVSAQGLQLQVAMNSSSIQSHGEVAVQIELLNTLSQNVSLTVVTNANISGWNEEDFFCSQNPSQSLVGFALFKGYYSSENISAAESPLQLAAPVAVPCSFSLGLNGTTFLPNSDKTMSSGYYAQTQEPPFQ